MKADPANDAVVSNPTVSIRTDVRVLQPMGPDDVSQVVAIRMAGNRDVDSFIAALPRGSQEKLFERVAELPCALSFVCKHNGETVGFLVLSLASAPALYGMAFSEDKRRFVSLVMASMLRHPSLLPRVFRRCCWLLRTRKETLRQPSIHIHRERATLLAIGVGEDHLRSGVGTLMITTALHQLRQRFPRVRLVDVWLRAENARAIGFLTSVGFVPARLGANMDGSPSQEMILHLV